MPKFADTRIYIAQLALSAENRPDVLVGHHFERCTILGPVILAPLRGVSFTSCTFGGEPDAFLWEVAPDRHTVIGVLGLVDCSFVGCRLDGIGIAGPPEFVRTMRDELQRGTGVRLNESTTPLATR